MAGVVLVVEDEVVVGWPEEESEPAGALTESEDEPDVVEVGDDPDGLADVLDGLVESEEDRDELVESGDELGEPE